MCRMCSRPQTTGVERCRMQKDAFGKSAYVRNDETRQMESDVDNRNE